MMLQDRNFLFTDIEGLGLGEIECSSGETEEAIPVLREALATFRDLAVHDMMVRTLIPVAGAELVRRPRRATLPLAATEALVRSGVRIPAAAQVNHQRFLEMARRSLEPPSSSRDGRKARP